VAQAIVVVITMARPDRGQQANMRAVVSSSNKKTVLVPEHTQAGFLTSCNRFCGGTFSVAK